MFKTDDRVVYAAEHLRQIGLDQDRFATTRVGTVYGVVHRWVHVKFDDGDEQLIAPCALARPLTVASHRDGPSRSEWLETPDETRTAAKAARRTKRRKP
jgi:hypothetical protein